MFGLKKCSDWINALRVGFAPGDPAKDGGKRHDCFQSSVLRADVKCSPHAKLIQKEKAPTRPGRALAGELETRTPPPSSPGSRCLRGPNGTICASRPASHTAAAAQRSRPHASGSSLLSSHLTDVFCGLLSVCSSSSHTVTGSHKTNRMIKCYNPARDADATPHFTALHRI